jgi:UDP-N-acetylglucosamine--N-acetylmuramyl-(pentapeptide) pyrophosphoryl-undecaprenol N-acetylglucosamine transferase
MTHQNAPILIMAGGTGGHIMPALAVAECLGRQHVPVVWLGTQQGLEAKLVPQAGYPIEWVTVSALRGKGFMRLLRAPFMLLTALLQALAIVRRLRPRAVLGMGGFASGPGGVAARCLGVPLLVHEQNAIPGLTNRCLARLAAGVFEAFPGAFAGNRQALTVGNPVRQSISELAPPASRWAGRDDAPRLLILGGSQGATVFNERLPQVLQRVQQEQPLQIWHQTGANGYELATSTYATVGVSARLESFIGDMAEAYAWADLVLCRAGALTVAELAAAGVGSILVPFPYAVDDHQTANARFLEQAGAAYITPQSELDDQRLAQQLVQLLGDRQTSLRMAEAARALAQPDAAVRVAELCLQASRAEVNK